MKQLKNALLIIIGVLYLSCEQEDIQTENNSYPYTFSNDTSRLCYEVALKLELETFDLYQNGGSVSEILELRNKYEREYSECRW